MEDLCKIGLVGLEVEAVKVKETLKKLHGKCI
jgi:hypothetical protein